jgi:MFS transporter, UMF1 family
MASLKQQRFGWYVYDWANSAFSTSVVTVFLGPYLTSVAKAAAGADGTITGWGMQPGAWFGYMVSLSVLLQVIILPIVGSITDRTGRKKPMLAATAFVGALATTMLFFLSVEAGNFIYGGILFVIANVAFGASVVVSNAFLPDLASSAERDKVSSFAWALGYLGGGLLLVVHLFYFQGVEASGGSSLPSVFGGLCSRLYHSSSSRSDQQAPYLNGKQHPAPSVNFGAHCVPSTPSRSR